MDYLSLPYKGEDLYSFIVRFNNYSSFGELKDTKADLFNRNKVVLTNHYINHLEDLSFNFSLALNGDKFNPSELIDKYLYLNLVRPFFTEHKVEYIYKAHLGYDNNINRRYSFITENCFCISNICTHTIKKSPKGTHFLLRF